MSGSAALSMASAPHATPRSLVVAGPTSDRVDEIPRDREASCGSSIQCVGPSRAEQAPSVLVPTAAGGPVGIGLGGTVAPSAASSRPPCVTTLLPAGALSAERAQEPGWTVAMMRPTKRAARVFQRVWTLADALAERNALVAPYPPSSPYHRAFVVAYFDGVDFGEPPRDQRAELDALRDAGVYVPLADRQKPKRIRTRRDS